MTNPLRENDGRFKPYDTQLNHLWAYTKINNDTGCFEWQGALDKHGYGKICTNHRTLRPHRLAYSILHNIELKTDQQLNHTCNNRRCWNPDHLYLGTQLQNIQDRDRDGCPTRGENHPQSKLTIRQVGEIKQLLKSNIKDQEIAAQFNISRSTVLDIKSRRTWRWLDGEQSTIL